MLGLCVCHACDGDAFLVTEQGGIRQVFKEGRAHTVAFFLTFHNTTGIVGGDNDLMVILLLKLMVRTLTCPWQGREGQMAVATTCERGRATQWGST